jgi:hypothetical protein
LDLSQEGFAKGASLYGFSEKRFPMHYQSLALRKSAWLSPWIDAVDGTRDNISKRYSMDIVPFSTGS